MEESIKNRLILILVVLTIIFFMGTIRSCSTARKLKVTLFELDKEKSASWDSEQKINELKKAKDAREKELTDVKAAHEITQKALLQEQLVSKSLKEELERVVKLKEKLEEDLKEALVQSGKSKR